MSDIQEPQEPEAEIEGPQDFVVVLAYTSTDGEIEEDFGRLVNDIKALYTFKNNVRAYAVVEDTAARVLRAVEKPAEAPGNKAVMVISYDQPGDVDEAVERLHDTANKVRAQFEDQDDVQVRIGIREVADSVIDVFAVEE